jgi:predicted DNA binding protein
VHRYPVSDRNVGARERGAEAESGKTPVMTPEKMKIASQSYDTKGVTVEEIAKTIGVSRKTVYRHLESA